MRKALAVIGIVVALATGAAAISAAFWADVVAADTGGPGV